MHYFENPHVPTSQFSPEFDRILELYDSLKPMRVLEIGSQHGGSLWHWLHRAQTGARVANIDLGRAPSMMPLDLIWRSWCPPGVEYRPFIGSSDDLSLRERVMEFLGHEIDFCFIDGDHTYKGARWDFAHYGLYSKVVVFHDLVKHQPHFGIGELWEELKQKHGTEEFWSRPGQEGGGIGVIYVADRA